MKVQIIEKNGRPEWAVIPYPEYERLVALAEDQADVRAYDQAKAELASGEDELVPAEVVARLSAGEHPLRVWREHRGLTQEALATAAGVGKSYVSQIESGRKTGTLDTLRRLAAALGVDLDDLTPWEA
jgi:DNA-binding XRE family transcriptional regulator